MSCLPARICCLFPIVAVLACGDDPTAPPRGGGVDSVATVSRVQAACTRHWSYGTDGVWSDVTRWNPAGVPDSTDVACIDAVGSYTVTVDASAIQVTGLVIGGRSVQATLASDGHGLAALIEGDLELVAGSAVSVLDDWGLDVFVFGGRCDLDGTLRVRSSFPGSVFCKQGITVRGTIDQAQGDLDLVAYPGDVVLDGTVNAGGEIGVASYGGVTRLQGGALTGAGHVTTGSGLRWSGGTIPPPAPGGRPRLRVSGGELYIGSDTLRGTAELIAWGTGLPTEALSGVIGPGLSVTVSCGEPCQYGDGTVTASDGGSGPLENRGQLILVPSGHPLLLLGPGLLNRGTLDLVADSGGLVVSLDSTVNDGTITLGDTAEWRGNHITFRNRGTVDVRSGGVLTVSGGGYTAESGSVVTGPMRLDQATVRGAGTLGDVTAIASIIDPGTPRGTLTAKRLVLDAASTVHLDIAGEDDHDQLAVLSDVVYGGTLEVQEIAPFRSAVCGQVLPVILDRSTSGRGSFAAFRGLAPGSARAWRLHNPRDSLFLVGHDPQVPVGSSVASVSVTEGGQTVGYSVCLRSAPSASVRVSPVSSLGQVAAMAPMTFTPATWALPQRVPVTAVDDALYEPVPVVDSIRHGVTSSDPAYAAAVPAPVAAKVIDNDGSANLELNVLSAPPVVLAGAPFTLSLREENLGPDSSPGAKVVIPASAGYGYVSSTGTLGCTTDAVTGTTCTLGSLSAGATQSFTVTFTGLVAGSYNTTYTLSSVQFDSNPINNSRTQLITVQ